MRLFAIIILSVCIGFDIGNYAMFKETGEYFLNMEMWYNHQSVSIFNAVIVFLLAITNK